MRYTAQQKKRALSSRRVLFLLLLRTYKTEFIHHRSHLVCKFAIQCPELGKFLRHVLFPQHLQLIVTAVPVVYLTVVKLIRTCHGTWMSLFQAINRVGRALSFSTTTLAQHHTSPTRMQTSPSMMPISLTANCLLTSILQVPICHISSTARSLTKRPACTTMVPVTWTQSQACGMGWIRLLNNM